MIFKKIKLLFKSLIYLLIVNSKILFCKINCMKTIIFCYPNYKLKNISKFYIEDLFNIKNNYKIIYLSTDKKNLNVKEIFIYNSLIKYLIKVDLFISNYVCDYFPPSKFKSYIHHDIYDTPLSNLSEEKNLKNRLNKYDHILIPSSNSKVVFERLKLKKKMEYFEIGYHKLNFLKNKSRKLKKKTFKTIIIAPTNFNSFPKLSMYKKINIIIELLLAKTNYNVIFRPHPSNLYTNIVDRIENKFSKYKNFNIDKSKNYFNTYSKSFLMITDLSGTAYTYSFLTLNPVLFFSISEKIIKKNNYNNLNYFKDRKKIGYIVNHENKLIKLIQKSKLRNTERLNFINNNLKKMNISNSKKLFEVYLKKGIFK